MAKKAGKKHTPTNNPSKTGASNWLPLEDVFQRWCGRLGLSTDAKDELEALLCDRETRSAKHKVDASGEEIPGTASFVDDPEFWRDCLLLKPDADGGPDRLVVDYTDAADIYLPDRHWKFYVRRLDVERWEKRLGSGNVIPDSDYDPIVKFEEKEELRPRTPPRLYPTTAALPPAPSKKPRHPRRIRSRPPASQTAPVQQPGNDLPKRVSAKTWVTDEAKRLKKDNKIPADAKRRPTEFAKLLERQLRAAADADKTKSIRLVGWQHIKNMLSDWGLWPVESIKIS